MQLRTLLLTIAFAATGCSSDPQVSPDAPVGVDAPEGVDGGGLPPGVTQLAAGNYLALADKAVGGTLYAVEYDGAGLVVNPVRIVAISTETGAVTTFHDLAASKAAGAPTHLRVTDTMLYWLQNTADGVALHQKSLSGTGPAAVVFGPSTPGFPSGEALDMYVPYPSRHVVYVLTHKGASYHLGSIPDGVSTSLNPYASLVTGSVAGATDITFLEGTSTLTVLGTKLYAGGYVSAASSGGAVIELDTTDGTGAQVQGLPDTHVQSAFSTAARAFWVTQGSADTRLSRTDGTLAHQGFVAMLPQGTYQVAALPSGAVYAASTQGDQTLLGEVMPSTDTANPPTGTTAPIVSIPTCANQASQDCTIKISTMATDDTSVYFSATTAIYKYTP